MNEYDGEYSNDSHTLTNMSDISDERRGIIRENGMTSCVSEVNECECWSEYNDIDRSECMELRL